MTLHGLRLNRHAGWIDQLFVSPSHQRRGVEASLLGRLRLAAIEGITYRMARSDSGTVSTDFDVNLVREFGHRCTRGIWLAFLALALLTVSFPSAAGPTIDRSPAVTSKLINTLAILRQDIPSSLILDSRSKPGWSRAADGGGAFQTADGHGIVPAGLRVATWRPHPKAKRFIHDEFDLPLLRYFEAQAPPPGR